MHNYNKFKKNILKHCLPKIANYMFVLNNGDCFLCGNFYGNLLEDEMPNIWNNPERKKIIKKIARLKSCETPCLLNCNFYNNGMFGRCIKCYLKYR